MRNSLYQKRLLREEQKSGEILFVEAMALIDKCQFEKGFEIMRKSAEKEHKESQFIWNVVKNMDWSLHNCDCLKNAFAKTECPVGWYFAALLCWNDKEQFGYFKKSSDAGYSWGQADYAYYLKRGDYVQVDNEAYIGLLEKSAIQNNPMAMHLLGDWYRNKLEGNCYKKAISYYKSAAELWWEDSMIEASSLLYTGLVGEIDLIQSVRWSSITGCGFAETLSDAVISWWDKTILCPECDFALLAVELGKGLYWYQYETEEWSEYGDFEKDFADKCLEFYCSAIESQQRSIFLFLHFWNQTIGVKDVGQLIGKLVWNQRYEHLTIEFKEVEIGFKRVRLVFSNES